jgi:hypothetical protein
MTARIGVVLDLCMLSTNTILQLPRLSVALMSAWLWHTPKTDLLHRALFAQGTKIMCLVLLTFIHACNNAGYPACLA